MVCCSCCCGHLSQASAGWFPEFLVGGPSWWQLLPRGGSWNPINLKVYLSATEAHYIDHFWDYFNLSTTNVYCRVPILGELYKYFIVRSKAIVVTMLYQGCIIRSCCKFMRSSCGCVIRSYCKFLRSCCGCIIRSCCKFMRSCCDCIKGHVVSSWGHVVSLSLISRIVDRELYEGCDVLRRSYTGLA